MKDQLGHVRAKCCREIDAGKQKPYRKRMAAAVARSGRDQRRQCASERVRDPRGSSQQERSSHGVSE